jgi:hypothetical protein
MFAYDQVFLTRVLCGLNKIIKAKGKAVPLHAMEAFGGEEV